MAGNVASYESGSVHVLDYVFQFQVSVPPEDTLVISIVVLDKSYGRVNNLVTTEPKSIIVSSVPSIGTLQGKFLVFGEPGAYVIELLPLGPLGRLYYPTSVPVNISTSLIVAAPELVGAQFDSTGARNFIKFSRPTDYGVTVPELAGQFGHGSWNCSAVFQFTSTASTICQWVDSTTVQLIFPTQSGLTLLGLSDPVTLLPYKIKSMCSSSVLSECARYPYAVSAVVLTTVDGDPDSPSPIISMSSEVGLCENITGDMCLKIATSTPLCTLANINY